MMLLCRKSVALKKAQKRSKFEISRPGCKIARKIVSKNGLTLNFTIWGVRIKPRCGDLVAP